MPMVPLSEIHTVPGVTPAQAVAALYNEVRFHTGIWGSTPPPLTAEAANARMPAPAFSQDPEKTRGALIIAGLYLGITVGERDGMAVIHDYSYTERYGWRAVDGALRDLERAAANGDAGYLACPTPERMRYRRATAMETFARRVARPPFPEVDDLS